jgi:hypothetical protein
MTKEEKTSKLFTPVIVSWIIAIAVGLVAPLFLQGMVAGQISSLSTHVPQTADEIVKPDPAGMFAASLFLFVLAFGYLVAVASQIYYIATLKTFKSIWPFVITVLGPAFMWTVVPYGVVVLQR